MNQSRTNASIMNATTSVVVQVGTLLIMFIQRTVLIRILGVDYLGIDGLFNNVLSVLNMAELGIGSALVYSMYKPMAYGDKKKINILMSLYKRVYFYIGIIILMLGLISAPFITFFINDMPNIPNVSTIYCLYIINSSLSYFFVYKSSIITVAQEERIIVINKFIFYVMQNVVQMICLVIFRNYIVYFCISIMCTLGRNVSISRIAEQRHPYIKEKVEDKLPVDELIEIKKNIFAMCLNKFGYVILDATDNLLISKLVSITMVGLYSNYSVIVTAIKGLVHKIVSATMASIGNLGALVDGPNAYQVFRRFVLLNHIIAGVCSICLYILLTPFVTIWLGEEYLLNNSTVVVIVLIFYIWYIRRPADAFGEAYGLFWNNRFKPVVESAVNLFFSIVLGRHIGINGIFLGTIISSLLVGFWVEPYVLYKHVFKLPLRKYFVQCAAYVAIAVLSLVVCVVLTSFFTESTIFLFIYKLLVAAGVPVIFYICFLGRTNEFQYYVKLLKKVKRRE